MYTVIINGVPVQCETAVDAIELTRQAASNGYDSAKPSQGSSIASAGSRWSQQRIKEFFETIGGAQRKLIDALLETKDGRMDDQLVRHLGLGGAMALGGVFTGLLKNAKKVGADPKDLYERNTVILDGKRHYEFKLTPFFRAAAEKWQP